MYKYIDLDEPILDDQLVQSFNGVFQVIICLSSENTLKTAWFTITSSRHFFKMVTESMNEALNALRPQTYPFSECKIATINVLKGL